MSSPRVACIAARNEIGNIAPLIWMLREQGFDVLVVNDGSTDGTAMRARHAGARVWSHNPAQGIAWSQLQAWSTALADGAQIIVQLDAGESHSPADAKALTYALAGADVVVGSRFMRGGAYIGGPRRYLSKLATAMCNARFHMHLTDWTSGYRAFTAEAATRLLSHGYKARMHGWQIEVLVRALQDGLRIAEVPITYNAGRSSFKASTAMEALGVWLRG